MGASLDSLVQIAKIVVGLFLFFGIPGLLSFGGLTLVTTVVTAVLSKLLTLVFRRLPVVARFFDHISERVAATSPDGDVSRSQLVVVGAFVLAYAVVYVVGLFATTLAYEFLAEPAPLSLLRWEASGLAYWYPILALIYGVPLALGLTLVDDLWTGRLRRSGPWVSGAHSSCCSTCSSPSPLPARCSGRSTSRSGCSRRCGGYWSK